MSGVFKESEGRPEAGAGIDQMVLQSLQNMGCRQPERIIQLARQSIKGRKVDVPKNEMENFRYARDMLAFVPQLEAKGYTTHEAYELVDNTRMDVDMIFFSSTRLNETDYDVGVLREKFKYLRENPDVNYRDATVATLFKGPSLVPEFRKVPKPQKEKKTMIAIVPKKLTPMGKDDMDSLLYSKEEITVAQVKKRIETEILQRKNNENEAALIMKYAMHWTETGKDLGPVEEDFRGDYEFARTALKFMPALMSKGYSLEDARNIAENAILSEPMRIPVLHASHDIDLLTYELARKKEGQPMADIAFSGPSDKTVEGRVMAEVYSSLKSSDAAALVVTSAKRWVETGRDEDTVKNEFPDEYKMAKAAFAFMPGLMAKGYSLEDARTTVENAIQPKSLNIPAKNVNPQDVELIAKAINEKEKWKPVGELAFQGPLKAETVAPGSGPTMGHEEIASAHVYDLDIRGAKFIVTLNTPLEGDKEHAFLDLVLNNRENVVSLAIYHPEDFVRGQRNEIEQSNYLTEFIRDSFSKIYQTAYDSGQVDVRERVPEAAPKAETVTPDSGPVQGQETVAKSIETEILQKRNNNEYETALIMEYAIHWTNTGKDLGPVEEDFREDYEFARTAFKFMPGLMAKGYSMEDARTVVENAIQPEFLNIPAKNVNPQDVELIAKAISEKEKGKPVGELAFYGPSKAETVTPGGGPTESHETIASVHIYDLYIREGANFIVTLNTPLEGNKADALLDVFLNTPENVVSLDIYHPEDFVRGAHNKIEQSDYLTWFIKDSFSKIYQTAYENKEVKVSMRKKR